MTIKEQLDDKNFLIKLLRYFETKDFPSTNKLEKDPKSKLISNYNELKMYLKNTNNKLNFKNIFYNIENIDIILYEADKYIEIKEEDHNQSLTQYFYLIMLMNKNKNIINYLYCFDFIRKISDKKYNKNLEKIIISKIKLELIDYYKELEIDEIIDDKEIKMIENENKLNIKNNLKIFEELGLKYNESDIEKINIDDLYVNIIYSLIINRKIEDYNYILNIFNQMNLSSIDVSKKIYDKLLENSFFNSEYINKFSILSIKDLYDNKKINFYYILFSYILKETIYIYQIPFLNKLRKLILNIIKSNLNNLFINKTKQWKSKISFLINKLCDCDYYKKKFNNYIDKFSIKTNNNNIISNHKIFHKLITDNRYNNFYSKKKSEVVSTINSNLNKNKKQQSE